MLFFLKFNFDCSTCAVKQRQVAPLFQIFIKLRDFFYLNKNKFCGKIWSHLDDVFGSGGVVLVLHFVFYKRNKLIIYFWLNLCLLGSNNFAEGYKGYILFHSRRSLNECHRFVIWISGGVSNLKFDAWNSVVYSRFWISYQHIIILYCLWMVTMVH